MKKRITVFADYQIFSLQKFGGISRVFTELYRQFSISKKVKFKIPILFSENENIQLVKKTRNPLKKCSSFLKKLFYYGFNRIYSVLYLIFGKYDVFHPTYYDPYFLPFLRKKPFVLTVHDFTHERYPKGVSKIDKTISWKKKLLFRADKIIAISESTKRDIIEFYNIDKEKIDVVLQATSLELTKKNLNLDIPKRYILFVGNRAGYKNFIFFFKSIVPLLKEDKDLYVLCAGSNVFTDEEINTFKEYNIEHRVIHWRFKGDEELSYLYNHALCFVFPSLYEGFGIPVLESLGCECPAVISNVSSLPEVGGDACEYFDPNSNNSIRKAIEGVIYDENKRKERTKVFSWEKTAKAYAVIYKSLTK